MPARLPGRPACPIRAARSARRTPPAAARWRRAPGPGSPGSWRLPADDVFCLRLRFYTCVQYSSSPVAWQAVARGGRSGRAEVGIAAPGRWPASATEGCGMRWDDLFRDLEAQLDAADGGRAGRRGGRPHPSRGRAAGPRRPGAGRGRSPGGGPGARGRVPSTACSCDVGSQWLLVAETGGREVLVPSTAVVSLAGLRAWSGTPGSGGQVFARLGLGHALRGIARDRAAGPGRGSSTPAS